MSKKYIAAALKRLRERTGMKSDDVGAMIGKSGKTVNAWENGRGQPDAETLIKLSVIYKVDNLLSEFDEENELNQTQESEKFRLLTTDEKHLLKLYNSMNDEGKEKAIERIEEMTCVKRFTEKLTPPEDEEIYRAASSSDNHPAEITKLTKEEQERIAKATRMTPENSDL